MGTEVIYDHLNHLSNVLCCVSEKSHIVELCPSDGALYKQLCSMFEAHAKRIEDGLNEGGSSGSIGGASCDSETESYK